MARKIIPKGADGNAFSWVQTQLFTRDEQPFIVARLSRAENTDLRRENRVQLERDVGKRRVDKMIKARYDWLFDDLQRFTSIRAEDIQTKEDLKEFLEATIGKSKSFQHMTERKYQAGINRALNSFWNVGKVDRIARTNVVEIVDTDRAKSFSKIVKREESKKAFVEASRRNDLFRVRREHFAIRRYDRRGRMYFYDPVTGRRVMNPDKVLRSLGFEV